MIEKLLEFEEGYRDKPYYCSEGYPTIGIGKKIGPKHASLSMYKFTCSREVAYMWLSEELKDIRKQLINYSWYVNLNSDRQDIIKSMAYQLGVSGLMKFKKMIAALEDKDWEEAEKQALDSKWARQAPLRAVRHASVLKTGTLSTEYDF
jgi:lysozyme